MLSSTVQDLKQEINRLQSLLQGWRALARPQQLNLQPTFLATLIAEVLRPQVPYYVERGIQLEQIFSPRILPGHSRPREAGAGPAQSLQKCR